MVKTKKGMSTKSVVLLILSMVCAATILTSCNKDVYSAPDFYKCIYDKRDGRLIEQVPPGGGMKSVDDQAIVIPVPTSQRFWNTDPQDNVRDPGAASWVTGREKGLREVQMNPHVRFFFNGAKICEWVERHGKRNISADVLANGNIEDKLGFNARGNPEDVMKQPWFIWLRENFNSPLQSQGSPLLQQYEWEYYELQLPTNASLNGELKCLETDAKGECTKREAASEEARKVIERQLSEKFTAELYNNIGGNFFCGQQYDASKPENCPPLGIEISTIQLKDRAPVQARQELINQREKTRNDQEAAQLTKDATDAAVAKRQAEVEQQNKLADLEKQYANNQAVIDAAKIQEETNKKKLEAIQQLDANCLALNATPEQCALIIAAEKGQYPQGNGQSVTINPNPSQPQK